MAERPASLTALCHRDSQRGSDPLSGAVTLRPVQPNVMLNLLPTNHRQALGSRREIQSGGVFDNQRITTESNGRQGSKVIRPLRHANARNAGLKQSE